MDVSNMVPILFTEDLLTRIYLLFAGIDKLRLLLNARDMRCVETLPPHVDII